MITVAAVDLGASSGRVMACRVGTDTLDLVEVHRFANRPVRVAGTLHWDILGLYASVLDGLAAAARDQTLAGVGIDSWAVDYGLIDASGTLIGNPVHYRDARTDGVLQRVAADLGEEALFATTGLQQLPFNTLYQLISAAGSPALAAARHLLLIPDLLTYWLTGRIGAEVTNASTTQLFDARDRVWAQDLAARAGIDPDLLPPLRDPGTVVGPVAPEVAAAAGLPDGLPVIAVASHDTASAVVAVPAQGPDVAYVSCGTWSLVGVELPAPVLTDAARRANFTNEAGVDGTIRFLSNVMGLWLLQESVRTWAAEGPSPDLPALLDEAAHAPAFAAVVDPDDPGFLPPGDMPARIADRCRATGQQPPGTRAATVRCILDSLALAYRRRVRQAQQLSGRDVRVVHVVGGGARNSLLCQLTADACGLPVVAGPVEAAALGNALVQARALGVGVSDLTAMRALVRSTQQLRRFEPTGDATAWDAAHARVWPGDS